VLCVLYLPGGFASLWQRRRASTRAQEAVR